MPNFKIGDRVVIKNTRDSEKATVSSYCEDGYLLDYGYGEGVLIWRDEELIMDTPTGPVRERVVKEIVPGVYGRLEVRLTAVDKQVCVGVTSQGDNSAHFISNMNATELRAAAATLLELAGALE